MKKNKKNFCPKHYYEYDTIGRIMAKLICLKAGYLVTDPVDADGNVDLKSPIDLYIKKPTNEITKGSQVTFKNCDYLLEVQVLPSWKMHPRIDRLKKIDGPTCANITRSHTDKFKKIINSGNGNKIRELTFSGDLTAHYVITGEQIIEADKNNQYEKVEISMNNSKWSEDFLRVEIAKNNDNQKNPFFCNVIKEGEVVKILDVSEVRRTSIDLYWSLMMFEEAATTKRNESAGPDFETASEFCAGSSTYKDKEGREVFSIEIKSDYSNFLKKVNLNKPKINLPSKDTDENKSSDITDAESKTNNKSKTGVSNE